MRFEVGVYKSKGYRKVVKFINREGYRFTSEALSSISELWLKLRNNNIAQRSILVAKSKN